jgi:hypothetical protein
LERQHQHGLRGQRELTAPQSNRYGVFGDPAATTGTFQPEYSGASARSIDGLQFTSGTGGWVISGTGILSITGNNANSDIFGIDALAQTSGINTISAVVNTGTNGGALQNWSVGTGGTLAFTNRIQGSAAASVLELGTPVTGEGVILLNLPNANARSGTTRLRAGTVRFNVTAPLGVAASPVEVVSAADGGAGVTLETTATASTVTLGHTSFTIGEGVMLTIGGTGAINISGTLFGAGGIEIQNPSQISLGVSGSSTYNGPLHVVRGRAHLGAAASMGNNNNALWTIESAGTLSFNNTSRNRLGDTVNHGVILMSSTAGSTSLGQIFQTGKTVSGTGAFLVAAPLQATGTADFTFGGTVAPGAAPGAAGKFTLGDPAQPVVALFRNAGTVLVWDLTGTGGVPGADFDSFDLAGSSTASIGAGAKLAVTIGAGAAIVWDSDAPYWRESHTFALFNTPAVTGTFTLQNAAYSGATGNGAFTTDGQNLCYAFTPASGPGVAITTQPSGQTVAEGGAVTFTVVATGTSPLTYAWSKDGVPLAADTHYSGITTATLALTAAPVSASGTYTVTVTNAEAQSMTSDGAAVLAVTPAGAPPASAPVAGAATGVTNTGFTANWSAVAGATGYKLDIATDAAFTSLVAGYNALDVGNVLTRAVTGLTANTQYYYRVSAYNSIGDSAASSSSAPATEPTPYTFNQWTGATSADFMTTANWSPAAVPSSAQIAVFADAVAVPNQPVVSAATNRTFGGIRFDGAAGGWTIAGTGTLTFGGNAQMPNSYGVNALAQTAGLNTISAVVATATAAGILHNWSVGTGGTLAFTGGIAAGHAASVIEIGTPATGAGAVILGGASVRTGTTRLRAGTVLVGNDASFGTTAARVAVLSAADGGAGATLAAAGAAAHSLAQNITLGADTALTVGAGDPAAGALTLTGTLTGAGSLVADGPVILTGNGNNFTGTTVIRPGALLQLGDGAGATGILPSAATATAGIVLEAGGTLAFNRTADFTFNNSSNPLLGAGEIVNLAPVTVSVSGNATTTFNGPVRVAAGRISLGNMNALGANNAALWTIESAGTLSFNNASRNRRGDTVNNGVILMSRTDGSTGNGQVFLTGKTVSGTGAFWTASSSLAATGTADFTFAGTVAPGAAPGAAGRFTFGDGVLAAIAQFQSTSVTLWDLTGTGGVAGADFDAFDLAGSSTAAIVAGAKLTVSIGGAAGIAWDDNAPYWRASHTFALFSTPAVTGAFTLQNAAYSGATGDGAFTTDGQNLYYTFTPATGPGVAIVTPPSGQTVNEGADATFTVVATGTSALTYAWSKNGAPITAGAGVSGVTTATLALSAVPLSAGGAYTVTVTNAEAQSETSDPAVLTVTPASDPPASAPVAGAATGVTQTGFTANWSAVAGATGYRLDVSTSATFAAGSFVTGAEIYENLDVGNVLSRAVTGLTAGTQYYYRVRAYNSVGAGADSAVSDPSTESAGAVFKIWNGSAGADFLTDANWTPAGPPASTGVAVFTGPAAVPNQPALAAGSKSINGLQFTSGTGGWTLAGDGTLSIVGNPSLTGIYSNL